jgi:hypothetical protein
VTNQSDMEQAEEEELFCSHSHALGNEEPESSSDIINILSLIGVSHGEKRRSRLERKEQGGHKSSSLSSSLVGYL